MVNVANSSGMQVRINNAGGISASLLMEAPTVSGSTLVQAPTVLGSTLVSG
jgi:hypothetical protein